MIWSRWDEIRWKEGIKASPIIQHEYSAKLYNVEGLDHKVHEPVTVLGMADMQIQDNWGMDDSGFNFLRTRA